MCDKAILFVLFGLYYGRLVCFRLGFRHCPVCFWVLRRSLFAFCWWFIYSVKSLLLLPCYNTSTVCSCPRVDFNNNNTVLSSFLRILAWLGVRALWPWGFFSMDFCIFFLSWGFLWIAWLHLRMLFPSVLGEVGRFFCGAVSMRQAA